MTANSCANLRTNDKIRVCADTHSPRRLCSDETEHQWSGGSLGLTLCVKHQSRIQSTIALSCGASERYGLVKGVASRLGSLSFLQDWVVTTKEDVFSASTAEASLHELVRELLPTRAISASLVVGTNQRRSCEDLVS